MSLDVTFRNRYWYNGSSAPSHTFNNCDVGAAAADRYVVVAAVASGSADTSGEMSVTIAGQTPTTIAYYHPSGSSTQLGFYGLLLPAGTTASVVVSSTENQPRWAVATFRALQLALGAADDKVEGTAQPWSGSIDCQLNGAVLGMAYDSYGPGGGDLYFSGTLDIVDAGWSAHGISCSVGGSGTTWGGLTEVFDYYLDYGYSTFNRGLVVALHSSGAAGRGNMLELF